MFELSYTDETARYEQHLTDQYDIITPENGCKTAPIFPNGPTEPMWAAWDRIVNWTDANSLKMRFHVERRRPCARVQPGRGGSGGNC